jgi:hypothetical protein
VAGKIPGELCIVVSGRLATSASYEAGRGDAIESAAFFKREPAQATSIALRDSVVLVLGWEELVLAFQGDAGLAGAALSRMATAEPPALPALPAPSRIVIAPAGAAGRLTHAAKEALLAGLESVAEVRVLTRQSFGRGMPGALAVDSPEIAHWLQEQELEFDLTLIVADEVDPGFAKDAIEEADEVLFIANGGDPALSAIEEYALEKRGTRYCRLIFPKDEAAAIKKSAEWAGLRGYAHTQAVDFDTPLSVQLAGMCIAGRGHAIAAASAGVYAASVLGSLQALEERGLPAAALAAAGSAILPVGLLACGKLGDAPAIFEELANSTLWKRSSRPEAGLYDPAPLDNFLVGALQGLEFPTAGRAFAAVSRSISRGMAEVHRSGRLHGAVRAGLVPPGLLPPLILEAGDILISGENESAELLAAARSLTASPVLSIHVEQPPLGPSGMSYRSLTGGALFRAAQNIDKRVRVDSVLGAGPGGRAPVHGERAFVLEVPEGVAPMDWAQWAYLRETAYAWTMRILDAQGGRD